MIRRGLARIMLSSAAGTLQQGGLRGGAGGRLEEGAIVPQTHAKRYQSSRVKATRRLIRPPRAQTRQAAGVHNSGDAAGGRPLLSESVTALTNRWTALCDARGLRKSLRYANENYSPMQYKFLSVRT